VTRRKALPIEVKQMVLHEAGYKCGRPACRSIITLDIHHLVHFAKGGTDTPENLLPLCGYCHDMYHAGQFPDSSIRAWKMLLLALNEAFDRKSIETLLALDKMSVIQRVSGDAVLGLGSLIAAGMLVVGTHMQRVGHSGYEELYRVELTPKGRVFVEQWKQGNQSAALNALAPQPTVTEEHS
jgi:hypothetical protein